MSDRPPPGDSVRVSDKSQLKWQLIEIGFQLVGGILCFTLLKRVMSHMDPMKQHKEGIQQVGGNHITCQNMRLTTELIQRTCTVLFQSKTALSKRLRRPELAKMNISEYEKMMADEVLDADEIEGGFDSIGGLEQEKRDVSVTLLFPWVCVHHVCDQILVVLVTDLRARGAATPAARHVQPAWSPPGLAQGHPALWVTRHWQDAARQGHRKG